MRCHIASAALATATVVLLASAAKAAEPRLNLSAGQIGVDRQLNNRGRYGMEYRFAPAGRYRLAPALGLVATESGAKYLYAALKRDFDFGPQWQLTPSLGVVGFDGNDRFDLGLALEFRSGLELSYRLTTGVRLGLALYHLSNASLGDDNPGTEEIVVTFSVPLR